MASLIAIVMSGTPVIVVGDAAFAPPEGADFEALERRIWNSPDPPPDIPTMYGKYIDSSPVNRAERRAQKYKQNLTSIGASHRVLDNLSKKDRAVKDLRMRCQ